MGRGPDGGQGASSRRRPSADPRPPRPAPASCPPPPQQRPGDPDARAFGGGGHGAAPSSLGVRGLWALVQAPSLVAALLGPVPPLPGPPRRTRQPLGGGGRGKVGGGRAGLSPTCEGPCLGSRRQRTQVLVGRPSCRPPLPPRTTRKNPRCTEGRAGTPGCSRVQAQPPATPHRCGLTF